MKTEEKNMTRKRKDPKITKEYLDEHWCVSTYNEDTDEMLEYYINLDNLDIGATAYLYAHEEETLTEMEVVHYISRKDDRDAYDALPEDVLLDGEYSYDADTSAEFIMDDDCVVVWFRYKIYGEIPTEQDRYVKDQTSETALLYTDGSYNKDLCIYGCGLILLDESGKEISRQHKTGVPQPGQNGWNINGEIEAALMGIQFAINLGYKKIKVYHDYEGVGKWPDKLWKATKPYTRDYADKVIKWRESVSIEFIHVKGHSGNNWNEIADQEARIGAKLI